MASAGIGRWAICGSAVLALHAMLVAQWPVGPAAPHRRSLQIALASLRAPAAAAQAARDAPIAPSITPPIARAGNTAAQARQAVARAADRRAAASRTAEPGGNPATAPARSAQASASAADEPLPPLPVYPFALPPPGRWHYRALHNGRLGEAELRWQHEGGRYEARLDARDGGGPVLALHSAGRLDAAGLAPERFVDQRVRRGAQAANFQRDAGAISYSGTDAQRPLPAGAQDRLSQWLQLSAIVAAQPGRWVPGAAITTYASGAHGDADVWTWVVQGLMPVDDEAAGAPLALRLHRDPLRLYDTEADAWLDPAHDYLPVRLRWRNGPYLFDLRRDG